MGLGLVVAFGVEGEVAEEFAVSGDDADVAVGDEHDDFASAVAGAHDVGS